MAHFILIHGAWHGGWVWRKVAPLLEKSGHQVFHPDLPGLGDDPLPSSQGTMAAYVQRVGEYLDQAAAPVILVGHSMAGIVISLAAERWPQKIRTLVFVTAHLIQNGESGTGNRPKDPDSQTPANLVPDPDQGVVTLKPQAIPGLLYHDCPQEDVDFALPRLRPQALEPFNFVLKTSEERFGSVERVYVQCLRDRVITPARQRQMYESRPCVQVHSLNTGHSPFFADPAGLAEVLLTVAGD